MTPEIRDCNRKIHFQTQESVGRSPNELISSRALTTMLSTILALRFGCRHLFDLKSTLSQIAADLRLLLVDLLAIRKTDELVQPTIPKSLDPFRNWDLIDHELVVGNNFEWMPICNWSIAVGRPKCSMEEEAGKNRFDLLQLLRHLHRMIYVPMFHPSGICPVGTVGNCCNDPPCRAVVVDRLPPVPDI